MQVLLTQGVSRQHKLQCFKFWMSKTKPNGRVELLKGLQKLTHLKELDLSSQVINDKEEVDLLKKLLLESKSVESVKLPKIVMSSDDDLTEASYDLFKALIHS